MNPVPGCGHLAPFLGCSTCFDRLKSGLAAAHENYEERGHVITNLRRTHRATVNRQRNYYKARAKWHRERAALNRENHRLLQNAHRKTLAKLRNKDRGNRLLMDANHRLRELERAVRKGMQDRPDLQADFDTVRDLLYTTAEYGLAVESAKAQAALFRIGLEMTRREPRPFYAASAPSAGSDPRSPSPGSGPPIAEYGCASLEPWDDDPPKTP